MSFLQPAALSTIDERVVYRNDEAQKGRVSNPVPEWFQDLSLDHKPLGCLTKEVKVELCSVVCGWKPRCQQKLPFCRGMEIPLRRKNRHSLQILPILAKFVSQSYPNWLILPQLATSSIAQKLLNENSASMYTLVY